MEPKELKTRDAARVSRHRKRIATSGDRRVEVTVPSRGASLVKAIADALRSNGEEAELIRRSLQPVLATPRARTGSELVAFLRASALTEAELSAERDRTTDRSAELGWWPFSWTRTWCGLSTHCYSGSFSPSFQARKRLGSDCTSNLRAFSDTLRASLSNPL